jgi:hypothetical protein
MGRASTQRFAGGYSWRAKSEVKRDLEFRPGRRL